MPAECRCYVLLWALLLYPPSLPAGPGPNQEELRRRVENGVKEFWYFVRSEVKKLATVEPSERQKYADTLLQDLGHQERWASRFLNTWEITTSGNVRMVWKKPLKIHGKKTQIALLFSQGITLSPLQTGWKKTWLWSLLLLISDRGNSWDEDQLWTVLNTAGIITPQ